MVYDELATNDGS